MNRIAAVLLVAVALVVAAGLAFRHVRALEERIAGLGSQVESLGEEVAEARERARQAEERAAAAEGSADAARSRAADAEERATTSAEHAEEAAAARTVAEEDARLSREEREAAEGKAREEEAARRRADAAREAAEQERLDAVLEKLAAEDAAREAEREARQLREQREREVGRLQDALSRIAQTRNTALGVVMNLDERHVEFDFDRAELRPRDRELLSRIAGVLMTFPDVSIQILGHTDDVGSDAYNQQLSERRAGAVRDYLVEVGIDPEIVSTRGLGESSPLVAGTDPESRQRNRRVELAITLVESHPGPVVEPAEP